MENIFKLIDALTTSHFKNQFDILIIVTLNFAEIVNLSGLMKSRRSVIKISFWFGVQNVLNPQIEKAICCKLKNLNIAR